MTAALSIHVEWKPLSGGGAEESACFAALGIRYSDFWLTEAEDCFTNDVRKHAHLSAYPLAEWLAWNWWRLRWEPRRNAPDWRMAHCLTSIGGGYVWPHVTIVPDGERVGLFAKPAYPQAHESLCYQADGAAIVRAGEFERVVDGFVAQVLERLQAKSLSDSNLGRIWADVLEERADPEAAAYRRLEALLGFDPGEADENQVRSLLADAQYLGRGAVDEVAAGHAGCLGGIPTAARLRSAAAQFGVETRPADAVRLSGPASLPQIGEEPAWKRGVEAARRLRTQEHLGSDPISNQKLAELAGVGRNALADSVSRGSEFSFFLDENGTTGRVVQRSKWETGRRFDLARLLGDRIAGGAAETERLLPATLSYSYRQQMQRAFAGELLCPVEALVAFLEGDFSPDAFEEAAREFSVSPRTVETLLVNNGHIDRDDFYRDFEQVA